MKKTLLNILIWALIPAAVGLTGFYVIGPNLGKVPVIEKQAQKVTTMAEQALSSPAAKEPEEEKIEPPKFTVEVEGEVTRRRSKRRDAEVETLTPGRPKEDEAAGADSPGDEAGLAPDETQNDLGAENEAGTDGAETGATSP